MKCDYGKEGLEISIDPNWNVDIIKPKKQKVIKNPIKVISRAIKNPIGCPPLREIIKKKQNVNSVCIVVSDATRPVPSHIILEALVKELKNYGIREEQINILVATGLHRKSREGELKHILGNNLSTRIKVIDHQATDNDSLKFLGNTTDKVPIYINKLYYESELKILTGYVEPHFFFGFSGGCKSIVPGIAGEKTIQGNHSAENIASPYSRFGVFEKNLMRKNSIEISRSVHVDFIVNVCINEEHKITKVAAGDSEKAHENLVNFQLKHVFKEISEPYDIVVCGNGGYPLDLNLYQAVKSMAIGELAVKKGGVIISVNELSDGIGHDNFRELIFSGQASEKIYQKILKKEIFVSDQWEIQILSRILMNSEIFVISKLKKEEIGNIGLKYAKSVEEAIDKALKKHGNNAKILILPNGPQILPLQRN